MPDTVVSNYVGEKGVMCSHGCSAAFKLPISESTAPSIPHTCAVAHYQRPDEPVPPLEVVSRRHKISVVNKVPELSEGCSPGREAAREQSHPTKSVTKKGSPISRISSSLGVHTKAQEQSAKAVLDRKSLEGSSPTGRVPHEGTASGLSSSNRGKNRVPARHSAGKVNIGPGEGLNANKHSPLPDAALTPHNPMPILSLQTLTAPPAKDVAPQSSQKFLAQHSPNAVSTLRAGSHVTHCKIETRQRVPDPPTHATAPHQPLNGPIPPIEVMSRRWEQGIVNKTSKENNIRSQVGLWTAERWSLPWLTDARSEGGEQLTRAAVYIQERLTSGNWP